MKPYDVPHRPLCGMDTHRMLRRRPVLTVRDWNGDAAYFRSEDSPKQDIFYKPYVGYVGDRCLYDPVAGDFKVLYLQDYRPNPELTYHPIWGVSTGDRRELCVAWRTCGVRCVERARRRPRHRLDNLCRRQVPPSSIPPIRPTAPLPAA